MFLAKNKYLTLCAFGVHAFVGLTAQSYFGTFVGYATSTNMEYKEYFAIADSIKDATRFNYPYGKGVNIGFTLGREFTPNIGADLIVKTQAFTRHKNTFNIIPYIDSAKTSTSFSRDFGTSKVTNYVLQVNPVVKFAATFRKSKLYLSFGPQFLYLKTHFEHEEESKSSASDPNTRATSYTVNYQGHFSLGFSSSIGYMQKINHRSRFFVELRMENSRYTYTRFEYKTYKVNGVDQGEYLQGAHPTSRSIDYSNVGMNMGLTWAISKR